MVGKGIQICVDKEGTGGTYTSFIAPKSVLKNKE
jgi:hypothetical protein